MLSPSEIDDRLERVLLQVQKPGRYVGGELNQIVKNWQQIQTHVALVFPDLYDLGLPNLGLAILYDQINHRADALAERAYLPWVDMEDQMRSADIPLYSLESHQPLAAFDIIGFTIPYETLFTNVLNALDLARLPLFATERNDHHPLIIAGGHGAFNPEPMAAFIDAFVIGEGEDIIHEIIAVHQRWKADGQPRRMLLENLARIPGVYIPAFYDADYHPDGTLATVRANHPAAAFPVIKRLVAQLPPPVTNFLVPNVDVVHNRVAIEIMRGCTHGCRFCHAGMITRPVRERPVKEVLAAIETALRATGYEEVGLLSLSSSDYTNIVDLVQRVTERYSGEKLAVSLPSLRIDSFSVDLMDQLKTLRPGGGFTLAPEAATDRMRAIINKQVTTDQFIETITQVYAHGWTTVKLYFMIGHPSETLEDVQAIADLCKRVHAIGRKFAGGRARVNAGVSTFIPKPHTPFQWVSCDSVEQINAKLDLLKRELRHPHIKLTWTEPETTLLEAWLSRGDRRLGEVIYRAWQNGARFDAWLDQYKPQAWLDAFAQAGLQPEFYSHRARSLDEVLPWAHISSGVRTNYLKQDFHDSLAGKFRDDCRDNCFACGILPGFSDLRMNTPANAWRCPPVAPRKTRAEHV